MLTNNPTPPEDLPRLASFDVDDILKFQQQARALWEQEHAAIRLTLPRKQPPRPQDDDED